MTDKVYKVDDRVKRTSGKGPQGTVKDVREEVAGSNKGEAKPEELLIVVQWDNGTCSYVAPTALEHA
ncbi:MAG: hypothetical protein KDD55_08430 [Bdellovibrionales bacterium]|nr:hypothetical protein [Bdellovibrionales bacterium]MCB0333511.1 hypothetical protein [Bdellovibrionales bacterium]